MPLRAAPLSLKKPLSSMEDSNTIGSYLGDIMERTLKEIDTHGSHY